jgi:SAM-dependent methyltransferase
MKSEPAYAVGQFREPDAEMERLRRQADVAAIEQAAMERIGLPETGRVLDLGCGPGFAAQRLRRHRPGLTLVGIDRDRPTSTLARDHMPVVMGQGEALPFASGAFDFVHLRLVLRHVPDPAAILREAGRTLRPDGRLGALDTDDGSLVLHPVPDGFAEVLAARQRSFQRRGADPLIGRKLPRLVEQAGFVDLQIVALPLTSFDIGPALFAAIVLAPVADVVDPDLCPREQVVRVAEAVRAWGGRADVFGMITAVLIGARMAPP